MKRILLSIIRGYRKVISPLKSRSCRFMPTCSAYALEAVERNGALRGGWLALKRILRCHPFAAWGYDPVPQWWPEPEQGTELKMEAKKEVNCCL